MFQTISRHHQREQQLERMRMEQLLRMALALIVCVLTLLGALVWTVLVVI
jgi:hypothetical protein